MVGQRMMWEGASQKCKALYIMAIAFVCNKGKYDTVAHNS